MKPCLVVYFSRTGITHQVASSIASRAACDIERLQESRQRSGALGFLRSAWESLRGKMPPLMPVTQDPGDYELVILGTPVWAGHVSSPMRSYLHAHAGRFNRIAAFCTMGGTGGDKVLDEIAALAGKPLVARIALTDDEIRRERHEGKLRELAGAAARLSRATGGA